ncbi:MAG: hypothetical protein DRO87_09870 [Candidatus Thorarchaeota archaeon]|nr:MAG: hypothetical protein DRO87_09870 [Candidatus Thorarchaeota archaeon]RLI54966.1 MAG: hypothetical protein DRP09_11295 [Candidatus Thorarchaeota archaeon]
MEDPICPEFQMYGYRLDQSELDEITNQFNLRSRDNMDKFLLLTDIMIEYVGSAQWKNRSNAFLAMCAKACFLRGMYGYNQILARQTSNIACKGYAAAAYCRQSLDPRWLNNLRNITNQAWQAQYYIVFSELSGQLASVLMDLGYADHAKDVLSEAIERVTKATTQDERIRTAVQAALLRPRILLAYISGRSASRDEAQVRLDSAAETAKVFQNRLAEADILYFRAQAFEDSLEHNRAMPLVQLALRDYERMGYLHGVADARNLRGVIHLNMGELQEARDQFEELLLIQQQLNNQVGLARTLINVGEIDRALGQLEQMETYNSRALEISQEAEYMRGIAVSTVNLGDIQLWKGNIAKAIEHYNEVVKLCEGTGMKQTLAVTLFLLGDAHFAKDELEPAMTFYERAEAVSADIAHHLYAFNAVVSQVITKWAMNEAPDTDGLTRVREALEPIDGWNKASDSSQMVSVRRRVLDDRKTDNEVCVFYDGEKCFECRVDREAFRKECFGNLFWKGSLCPYFKKFIAKL